MYCQNRISYRVQEGDSLYKLAKQFQTTVNELILLNSGVNPYNLQTGMRLTICPGEGYVDENESKPSEGNTNKPTKTPVGGIVVIPGTTTQPGGTTRPGTTVQPGGTTRPGTTTQPGTATRPGTTTQPGNNMGVDLRQRMRMAWLNHITLVKFYLISFLKTCQVRMRGKTPCTKMQRRFLRFLLSIIQLQQCRDSANFLWSICV